MDLRQIKRLIELLQHTGVAEIEITEGKESVRIRITDTSQHIDKNFTTQQNAVKDIPSLTAPETTTTMTVNAPVNQHTLTSPMVGTVYLSSKPDTKAYVQVGQVIKAGDAVCQIEAMKMRNIIEADKSGKIVSIAVDNGTCVEYGQPLFIIE